MTTKAIAVGDPVLFQGDLLTVDELGAKGVAVLVGGKAECAKIRAEILKLREGQAALEGAEHKAVASQIEKLSGQATLLFRRARLRASLLTYWPERGVWIVDGQILSAADRKALKRRRILPDQHKALYDSLHPVT